VDPAFNKALWASASILCLSAFVCAQVLHCFQPHDTAEEPEMLPNHLPECVLCGDARELALMGAARVFAFIAYVWPRITDSKERRNDWTS
jgi:hypothetical protein